MLGRRQESRHDEKKYPVSEKTITAKGIQEDLMRCGHLRIHNFQARVVRLQYLHF
jgi:hypothetical protein